MNTKRFREWLTGLAVCVLALPLMAEDRPTHAFDRQWLISHAETLAGKPYQERKLADSHPLNTMSYDDYRAIEFARGASIWTGEERNFIVDLLHLGFIYKTPVNLNLVSGGIARRVLYNPDVFRFDGVRPEPGDSSISSYSGFRVGTEINRPGVWDEFLVFQGASYFRAVSKNQRYGISARGLAVKTASPEGEEFPVFTDFWIERPAKGSKSIVVHALLDSPSLTGAYSFTAHPGDPTAIDVDSVLFPRRRVTNYGIAPLTSMFFFDATNRMRFDDFRPAVHDSGGLRVDLRGGEKLWRPLANPASLQVSWFAANNPAGFGLMQRHGDFGEFEDIEARYELRPSVWVEPQGDWGPGHVVLVEIPTDSEIHDNIVAFWQPEVPLSAGGRQALSYRLHWGEKDSSDNRLARVSDTRTGSGGKRNARRFVIDFEAGNIPADLEIDASTSAGTISDSLGVAVPAADVYRVYFTFDPEREDLAELRLSVTENGKPWSETWLYRWTK